MANTPLKVFLPEIPKYANKISAKQMAARKYNPLMKAISFTNTTDASFIPGQPWTKTQIAMMLKMEKRIIDVTSHGATAEIEKRAK